MHSIQVAGDKLLAQADFFAFGTGPVDDFIPPARLQDSDIVIFFILPDLFCNFHPLTQYLHHFIIQVVDLLTQGFQRGMVFL